MSCPTGDLLTRAHLDALDSFTPANQRPAETYAWSAWHNILEHRAECLHCRPRLARPDGAFLL